MQLELDRTVVLITGGSKGIGLACARAFVQEGAQVAIASRSQENLDRASATLRQEGFEVFTVTADLRHVAQAQDMARKVEEHMGGIGVLVNSAGAAQRTPPAELTAEHWQAAMQAKYFTYIHAIDAVLPGMVKRGGGVVVNVIGMGGKVASPNAFAGKNIRINAVNPGATLTEPREIADVVVFLASKRASYVNGAVLSLDGGATPAVV